MKIGLILVVLMLGACGRPSRATRTALDEVHALDAECRARARAVAESATSLEEGRAQLVVESAGCVERARVFCLAHHLDCSEVLP
jgi:hypothetical protein